MRRNLLPVALLALSGCATAPVGFYESAFPSNHRFSVGYTLEGARYYNSSTHDPYTPDRPVIILGISSVSFSPVPSLTMSPEFYGFGKDFWGGMIKLKKTLSHNDDLATALIIGGGGGYAADDEPLDPWGGSTEYYRTGTVEGGFIWSKCFREKDIDSESFVMNMGPKIIYTYLDYNNGAMKDGMLDYGGFWGCSLGEGNLVASIEGSLMLAERATIPQRVLLFTGGAKLRFGW
jgi:hypothetical protein